MMVLTMYNELLNLCAKISIVLGCQQTHTSVTKATFKSKVKGIDRGRFDPKRVLHNMFVMAYRAIVAFEESLWMVSFSAIGVRKHHFEHGESSSTTFLP